MPDQQPTPVNRTVPLGHMSEAQRSKVAALIRAVGVKGDLARAANRVLVLTPEYAQARKERCARAWLAQESHSYAEAAYELLMQRVEDLDPPATMPMPSSATERRHELASERGEGEWQ